MSANSKEGSQGSSSSVDNLKNLQIALHTAAAYMSVQAKYEDVAIFLGSTRSGKSSLINYIIGNKLVGERMSPYKPIILKKADNSPGPQIGTGSLSETIIPSRWESKKLENLGVWDAPGFDDNRGAVQDIINAFYINELCKNIKSAKIILVTDINDIANDSVRPFLSLLESVENILGQKMSECYSGIGIIFSKVPNTLYDNTVIVDKNFINQLLHDKFLSSNSMSISEPAKQLISHLKKNNQNIGLFKRAPAGDVSSGTIDAGIFEAIKEIKSVSGHILQQVSPSITHSSKVFLYNVRQKLSCMKVFPELQKLLERIFREKLVNYKAMREKGISHDVLIKWTQELSIIGDRISKVLDSNISFNRKISELRVIDSSIEELIQKHDLRQKAKFMEFVDQVLNMKESTHFDINLQNILVTAKTKVDELLIWVKLQLKEITLKEAEAQALRIREQFENEIQELKGKKKDVDDHNEKVKKESGFFGSAGSAIDSGVEYVGSAIYTGTEYIGSGIKNVWNSLF